MSGCEVAQLCSGARVALMEVAAHVSNVEEQSSQECHFLAVFLLTVETLGLYSLCLVGSNV